MFLQMALSQRYYFFKKFIFTYPTPENLTLLFPVILVYYLIDNSLSSKEITLFFWASQECHSFYSERYFK